MVFQGEVLSIADLIEQTRVPDDLPQGKGVGVRHTAAGNAARCRELLAGGGAPETCWRHGILQTLDDYNSTLRRGGPELAEHLFSDEPAYTGSKDLDAAFAALADYLAERDGWTVPLWALNASRVTQEWFPSVPEIFKHEAKAHSPRAFRERGIYITQRSLSRA